MMSKPHYVHAHSDTFSSISNQRINVLSKHVDEFIAEHAANWRKDSETCEIEKKAIVVEDERKEIGDLPTAYWDYQH